MAVSLGYIHSKISADPAQDVEYSHDLQYPTSCSFFFVGCARPHPLVDHVACSSRMIPSASNRLSTSGPISTQYLWWTWSRSITRANENSAAACAEVKMGFRGWRNVGRHLRHRVEELGELQGGSCCPDLCFVCSLYNYQYLDSSDTSGS